MIKYRHVLIPLMTLAFWKSPLRQKLPQLLGGTLVKLLNEQRTREKHLDYVIFTLPQQMPALPVPMNWLQRQIWGDPDLSLSELELAFRRIAKDERVKGVVLHLQGFGMSLADLQTLRDSMIRLRQKGKRVICFAVGYDTASYYVATAADEIILQPSGALMTLGLQNSITFMRDALATIGIEVDAIAISPYKSAADALTHQDITPEVREQINWLLDSRYEQIVAGIAAERNISTEAVQQMIDHAPYSDLQALELGYIDQILTEEGLISHLESKHIIPWEKADEKILLSWQAPADKVIAVLPLTGLIVDGESVNPPNGIPMPFVDAERMGSLTVVQQVRSLMQEEQVGAVVLFIDSGGGSATASEMMASALTELAKTRPVVAYMNGVAASGGYYISTPAHWIVAQGGTMTGSIGVLLAKVVNNDLLKKLRLNTLDFQRGKNASLESSLLPFTEEQREQMTAQIHRSYSQFLDRVAQSRGKTTDEIDQVGGGRVWTGVQALENGLVDQLGGLQEAIEKARELANLPDETPAILIKLKNRPLGPQLAEQLNPAAQLLHWQGNLKLLNGQALYLMPWV